MKKLCGIFLMVLGILFLTPTVNAAQVVVSDDFVEMEYEHTFIKEGASGQGNTLNWTLKIGQANKKYAYETANKSQKIDVPPPQASTFILIEDTIDADQELDESSIRFSVPIYAATKNGQMSSTYIDYDISSSFTEVEHVAGETYDLFKHKVASMTATDDIYRAYGIYDNGTEKTLIVYIRQIPDSSLVIDFTDNEINDIVNAFEFSPDTDKDQIDYTINGNSGIVTSIHVDFSTTYTLCDHEYQNTANYKDQQVELPMTSSATIVIGTCNPLSADLTVINRDDGGYPIEGSTFVLTALEGDAVGEYYRSTTSGDGSLTFYNLPLGTYEIIQESVPSGYEPLGQPSIITIDLTNDVTVIIVNRALTEINRLKIWEDEDNINELRPDSIELRLFATVGDSTTEVEDFDITWDKITQENIWAFKISDLYKYQDGQTITYHIHEEPVEYYENGIIDSSYNIINTLLPIKEIIGTVTWDDCDDIDKLRPTSITLILSYNGIPVDATAKWVFDGNVWTYTFYVIDTEYAMYEVTAPDVYGYTMTQETYDIIYTHVPEVPETEDNPVTPVSADDPKASLPSAGVEQSIIGLPLLVLGLGLLMIEIRRKHSN